MHHIVYTSDYSLNDARENQTFSAAQKAGDDIWTWDNETLLNVKMHLIHPPPTAWLPLLHTHTSSRALGWQLGFGSAEILLIIVLDRKINVSLIDMTKFWDNERFQHVDRFWIVENSTDSAINVFIMFLSLRHTGSSMGNRFHFYNTLHKAGINTLSFSSYSTIFTELYPAVLFHL